ncbi:MAG: outer membrane protein assembly factor BamB [Xanthomonadales bacterium]|nr:outer membrane protein assembly factor BamB [Xanthomonadales bacterium]
MRIGLRSVLPLALVACALALGGCSWLRTLGGKDNVEPPSPLVEFAPTVNAQRLWSARVGGGAGMSGALITPVEADGRLYAAGIDGSVEALDAATGRSVWKRRIGERQGRLWRSGPNSLRWTGGPAVDGDLLVVGGLDGQLYALSASDGSERWHVQMSSEIIASPAISSGLVVVRTNDGRLVALDASDGSHRWIFDQPVPALSLRGNAAPLVSQGMVYDGFDNGRVVALRLDDGIEQWVQTLSAGEGRTEVERLSDVDGALVMDGGTLYAAGYRGQVLALASGTGRPVWQRDLSSYAGAAVGGKVAVIVDADGNVWAFDRDTGANLWKQDQLRFRWLSGPVVQGDYVAIGDSEGYVHWLTLDEGKFAARERLGRKAIEGKPLVVGDVLYVEDVDGRIGAYRLAP